MNHLMLVTVWLEDGTSEDAREDVHDRLIEDDTFRGKGGRFGSTICDSFVLGGRWSGLLRKTLLGQPYLDALEAEFPQFTNGPFPVSLSARDEDGLNNLWQRFGGTGVNPLTRDWYEQFGADDDAMLVTPELYEHFLKPVAGYTAKSRGDSLPDIVDLDFDKVDESFIGSKWLVVVDYHN